jgi:biopolymer transport protein ExbB
MQFIGQLLLRNGGPMMIPLLILLFLSFLLFFERFLFLHKSQVRVEQFLEGIKNLIRKGRIIEAITVCKETPGPIAVLIKSALVSSQHNETAIQTALQSAALAEIPLLERRIGSIGLIAKIAPLIGFVGTLLSLLEIVHTLQNKGPYSDVVLFSPLLIQSLMGAIIGLIVAIISYLGYYFLCARVRGLVQDMEWAGQHILSFLKEDAK